MPNNASRAAEIPRLAAAGHRQRGSALASRWPIELRQQRSYQGALNGRSQLSVSDMFLALDSAAITRGQHHATTAGRPYRIFTTAP